MIQRVSCKNKYGSGSYYPQSMSFRQAGRACHCVLAYLNDIDSQ